MKAITFASVIFISSCCTPTIQYKTIPIPERYFISCEYPDFELPEHSSWYDAAVGLTEYSSELQSIIEKCNNTIKSIEKLNNDLSQRNKTN